MCFLFVLHHLSCLTMDLFGGRQTFQLCGGFVSIVATMYVTFVLSGSCLRCRLCCVMTRSC